MNTSALGHHALLILLLQIAIMVGLARILGELARRAGWPSVVGELLCGILLGPTILGKLWPDANAWLFPGDPAQTALLTAVGRLGVLLLLLVTGLEIDLGLILRRGPRVLQVSLWGTLVPILCGLALGLSMPDYMLQNPAKRWLFALFLAVAMSISALAVLAKILFDIQSMQRELGQTMVAIAMTEDLVGWISLSAVVALAAGELATGPALQAIGGALLFLGLAFTAGRWLVDRLLTWTDDRVGGVSSQISAVIALAMLGAAATHALRLEPMLGALVAGILAGQSRRFQAETEHSLKLLVTAFLGPIFFASAGLKVDLLKVINPTVFGWGLVIFAMACFCKLAGVALGGWLAGFSGPERVAMGLGLNARGSMEIIVATVGLNLAILSVETYSILVLLAMSTCLFTPPLLRWAFQRIPLNKAEKDRLHMERHNSFWRGLRRVLVPLRGGPHAATMAQLVIWLNQVKSFDCTLLNIQTGSEQELQPTFAQLSLQLHANLRVAPTVKKTRSTHPVELILRESGRGYELMLLGASQDPGSLFNDLTDRILHDAPCPIAVVRGPMPKLEKILLPTAGTADSAVVELAAALSAASGASLTILHVLEIEDHEFEPRSLERLDKVADSLLQQQAEVAQRLCPDVQVRLTHAAQSDTAIVRIASEEGYDLVIMRGVLRRTLGRAFLGHRAERLLARTSCPVMVVCNT
ncbi:cation:proton antiporter [bacterium]|nr:cation:proton antiporter [bacterium]